jgi:hypothetical protein
MSAKPWIKLWTRWYESSSHALLSPDALHTGPHLLVLAGKYGRQEDGSARLVGPHGKPLSISELAKLTRWTSAKMARILGELRQCETLAVVADAYTFTRFEHWQESKSAGRMRRHRGVTVTPEVTPVCAPKTEDRRQRTEDITTTPLPPKGGEREWGEVAQVCDRLPWIAAKGKSLLSPRDRIHKLVVNGATADEIVRVLEGLAAAVEAGKEPVSYWNAQYVFSGHYDRLRTAYGVGAAAVEKPNETMRERLARLQAERGEV